jgi:hypothetical protein
MLHANRSQGRIRFAHATVLTGAGFEQKVAKITKKNRSGEIKYAEYRTVECPKDVETG